MTRDQIVELLNRRLEALKKRDFKGIAAIYTENAVAVSPFGGVQEGRDEIERTYRLFMSAFGDIEYLMDEPIVDGGRVVQIGKVKGTHTGDFFGVAPTGRHLEFEMASVFTFENGLIKEERRIYDFTGVLIQIGVLKAKPSA
jgi:predicted ester cyclase